MGKYTRYTLSDNKDNNFYLCSWMSLVNMLGNKCQLAFTENSSGDDDDDDNPND